VGDTPARMRTITTSGEYDYDRVDTVSLTKDGLTEYMGRYYSTELDIYWTIVIRNDHLICRRRKYVDSHLTSIFADGFSDDWLPIMGYPTTYLVVFERDERDTITGFRVSGSRVRNLRFTKQNA
jgi:hypothetical protein